MSSSDAGQYQTQDDTQIEHATYTDTEVRDEQDPGALENAQPTHGGQDNVQEILSEVGAVGGSDNTSGPAGANTYYEGSKDALDRVTDSDLAKDNYQNELTRDPGIKGA